MKDKKSNGENKGFKVVDRRTSANIDDEVSREKERAAEETGGTEKFDEDEIARKEFKEAGSCPEFPDKMDFVTFILSMSQTALLTMGCGPNPETGKTSCDLRSAKCTIDILEIIQEKTRGNLTGEEERILERILTELRLMWLQKKKEMTRN